MRSPRRLAALLPVAAVALAAQPVQAQRGSLPDLDSGPRPGPNILYAPPATAPQLTNAGPWTAPPILVSGASAYRRGEFLYQDFLYDDHGADGGQRDPNDPRSSGDLFSSPDGTYTYPTDSRYAGNAADLVELRVKPLGGSTAFRITLNTLKDPSLVAGTIVIGRSPSPVALPHGANASAPGQLFLTWHGSTGDLLNPAGTTVGAVPPSVSVDMLRRQITVTVPHADWAPQGVVRLAAGVGLWDSSAGKYLIPQGSADATHPGGAGTLSNPEAFFNVAFRNAEPPPHVGDIAGTAVAAAWWRDHDQGQQLKSGDLSAFHADVDFTKLAAGTDDESAVPTTGAFDRILASHFETEQGTDYSASCGKAIECLGELRGQLQPYAIYVPTTPAPASGYGLTLLLHSLSANYNQYLGSRNQSQLANRTGAPSIVITPAGRGPDGWYYGQAGADTFEVWADVASRYHLDPDLTDVTGYSMGGYGTYKFATEYPDLFGLAQPTVGPPALGIWVPPTSPTGGEDSNTNRMLGSARNVPFLIWVQHTDELVPYAGTLQQSRTFDGLGYRYIFDAFAPGDHLTLAINDQYQPAADFLGTTRVDRNPPHVTYVVNPTMDFAADGAVADHAYWLSDIRVRDPKAAHQGTVDVRSEGFGVGDPAPSGTQFSGGALVGGNVPVLGYDQQSQSWGAAPSAPVADRLDVSAVNVGTVTVDPRRARVDCNAVVDVVHTDGPLTVVLAGCGKAGVHTAVSGSVAAAVLSSVPNTGGSGAGAGPWLAIALLGGAGLTGGRRRIRIR